MSRKRPQLAQLLLFMLTTAALACGGREGDQDTVREMAPEPEIETEIAPEAALPANVDAEKIRRVADEYRRQKQGGNPPQGARKKRVDDRVSIEDGGAPIELPDDYPADVPILPNATPTRYIASSASGAMTTLTIEDSPPAVRNFYVREIAAQGWQLESDQSLAGLTILSAKKDDRDLAVTIEDKAGVTHVVVVESTKTR